jgi:hypothetical protein
MMSRQQKSFAAIDSGANRESKSKTAVGFMRDLIIEQIERLASLEHGGGVNQAVSEYFRDHPGKWQA